MQRFLSLGTECVKIQETANASQGITSVLLTSAFYFYLLVPILYMLLMSFPLLAAALVTARARISALEDEVKASVEA
jgi:hypothetical protein